MTNTYATGGYTTTPNGAASFGWAAWLADHYYYSANTMDKQAGLQIAIWKILYETQTMYENDLSQGDIRFSGNSNAMSAAVNYINDWITAGKPSDQCLLCQLLRYGDWPRPVPASAGPGAGAIDPGDCRPICNCLGRLSSEAKESLREGGRHRPSIR